MGAKSEERRIPVQTYTIQPGERIVNNEMTIAVVGCGGTGGFVAEGLCRLLMDYRRVRVLLVDHDRVEPHNLRRQAFYPGDVGKHKSEVLAQRLSSLYGRPVAYSTRPYSTRPYTLDFRESNAWYERGWSPRWLEGNGLILGCVDNAVARKGIAGSLVGWDTAWWIDAGNGDHYGQVLIGSRKEPRGFLQGNQVNSSGLSFDVKEQICSELPLPSQQLPALLFHRQEEVVPKLDCAQEVQVGDQSPTINQMMAALMLDVVRQFLFGELKWMGLYVDLKHGTLTPVMATPENAARAWGVQVRDIAR